MLCYLSSIAYKMCIIPLMTGFALTCPRAHNGSAGRLWHCICQPLLQALFRGFHRGHVTQSETLRPAATHLQQGDAAVKHACPEKKQQQFKPRFVFTMHHSSLRVHFITANCNFFCPLFIVAYQILWWWWSYQNHTVQTWKCFTSVSLIKVIIHNEPEKCLWLRWCNSEVINSYLCFIWHT